MVKEIEEDEYTEVTDSDYEAQQINEQKKNNAPRADIVNKEALLEKLAEMQQKFNDTILRKCNKKKIGMVDHMSIVSAKKVETQEININDDIQREVQFYTIALSNAKLALEQLESEGVKTEKPDDFMAQMYKHDKDMQKIKNKLVQQQVKIQGFEEKQMRLDNKKFQKNLKNTQDKMKHKEKRTNLEAIDQWKEEIKEKGEKAKDLSEFVMTRKTRKAAAIKNAGRGATKSIYKRGDSSSFSSGRGRGEGKSFGGRQSYQKHETTGGSKGKEGNKYVNKKGTKQAKGKRPGKNMRGQNKSRRGSSGGRGGSSGGRGGRGGKR